jgi:hypothetical protein
MFQFHHIPEGSFVRSSQLNITYYPAQNMPIFVNKLIVALNAHIQQGQNV